MTRPVIFLDFDGVLNSSRSALAFGGAGQHQFDPVAVNLVSKLASADGVNASVVISSAWRVGKSVLDLRAILSEYSITLAARVIGTTPWSGESRGHEIACWLAEHPNEHNGAFVILDDQTDMLPGQLAHFVQVKHRDGFTLDDYLKALEILEPAHRHLAQYATSKRQPYETYGEEHLDWSGA